VIGNESLFPGRLDPPSPRMDLKKGLASARVPSLGYMVLSEGCGAPVARDCSTSVTHAFFKAMFCSSGSASVIHAMEGGGGHETRFLARTHRLMGGLRKAHAVNGTPS